MASRGWDISRLAGHVPEPYQQERVLEAARRIANPFLLREMIAATGLPKSVTHRVLSRLTKRGDLIRWKASITYPALTDYGRRWIPGARQRRVYLYRLAGRD